MNSKFKFKLESVLKLRAEKTNEAKGELQTILKKRIEKEEEIEEIKNKLANHNKNRSKHKKLENIQAFYHHKDSLSHNLKQLSYELDNLKDIENLKRDKYNSALKEEKVMEKLKEKKYAEHMAEIERIERNELDEIAIRQFTRKVTNA